MEIGPDQRDALRTAVRGERPHPDTVALARQAIEALVGAAGAPGPRDRAAIADYLLGRQSPGQAEGTWRRLEAEPAAATWAKRAREILAEAGLEAPPPLPGDDGALSPTDRLHRRRSQRSSKGGTLAKAREERSRRRTAANAQQAAAELVSPYRAEALEAYKAADDKIELPRWAPRPVQLSMYAVLAALVVGLAFCILVRIPVNTNAVVLVVDVPPQAPGAGDGGLSVIALFPQQSGQSEDTGEGEDVRQGDELRVALPGQTRRTPMRLAWVSPAVVAPRDVVDRYRLPLGQANRVAAPGYIAIAPLKTPPGKRPRSYEGTTTTEASVQTGSRRIISLLF
jgi:hypothetical protein